MKALLVLEDGFTLEGVSFTGPIDLAGAEVIFHTAMAGYQELLTNPAHAGHMVCATWPLIGNYGINPDDMESDRVHLSALLVKECCKQPSNWRSTESLPDYLVRQGVPGIEGLDTRALTVHLRGAGSLRGAISTSILDPQALLAEARRLPSITEQNLVSRVAPAAPYRWDSTLAPGEYNSGRPAPATLESNGSYRWPAQSAPRLLVYDFGTRWNVLRQLAACGFDMLVVPPSFTSEQVQAAAPDAIFLSSGPGCPTTLTAEIATITQLANTYPIAGVGLGHQLLALALGGKVAKLPFGHHGANHPVKNLATGTVEISTQNHSFHVLPEGLSPTHINVNDQSLEGFRHPSKPVIAIQHHPENASGPAGHSSFFEEFKAMVMAEKK